MKIKLSKKQTKAWRFLEDPAFAAVVEVMFGGAAGAGKSWFICVWQIHRRLTYPGSRGFIGRNVYADLKITTVRTFYQVWSKYFQNCGVSCKVNINDGVISFSNGSEIILRQLRYDPSDPDYSRLGSLELTDAAIDEATGVPERAFEILSSRVRFMLPDDQAKILLTGNPSNNWVKRRFIKDDEGNPVVLPPDRKLVRALLTDNPDDKFAATYKKLLERLPWYDRRRLLDGDWDAQARTGGEAYYSFNVEEQV
jgi:phage terminase large subunit